MHKVIILILILIIALSTYLGVLIFSSNDSFDLAKVTVSLEGNEKLNWGKKNDYQIIITNKSKEKLTDLSLQIKGTEQLQIEPQELTLEKLNKNSEKKLDFQLRAYGNKDQKINLEAEMNFQIRNTDTTFTKKTQKQLTLANSPLKTNVTQASSNNFDHQNQAQLKIENKTDNLLPKIQVTLKDSEQLPGLRFSDDKNATNSKKWTISSLAPASTNSIIIKGTGQQPKELEFQALFEIFGKNQQKLYKKIQNLAFSAQPPPLTISHKFPDKQERAFTPGEEITVQTILKNNSSSTIEGLNLNTKLEGAQYIEPDSITPSKGSYNRKENQIIATSFPPLEAGGTNELEFSFQVKDAIEISDQNQEAQIFFDSEITFSPKEESKKRKLTASNKENLKIETNLEIHTNIDHITGPHPPEPEEESTYKITWKLLNSYNDISNLEVTTVLPEEVEWEKNSNSEKIKFDEEESKVSWKMDTLLHGTGWLSPIKEAYFKLSLQPEAKKDEYYLTGETTAKGVDQFRDKQIKKFDSALKIDLK